MKTSRLVALSVACLMSVGMIPTANAQLPSMVVGQNGYTVSSPLFTVGESFGSYTPLGILDGLGAYRTDGNTVRVLANHELLNFRGYPYEVNGGLTLNGARVSYFDIDISSKQITAAGQAYETVIDASGNAPSDPSFIGPGNFSGFSRFCSSQLVEAGEFNNWIRFIIDILIFGRPRSHGLEDRIYFTGEEDGGFFNPVGGAVWALDPATGTLYQVPALGRGAWENLTVIDSGNANRVAVILADDSSPFDFDNDGENEAAPLFLYVGKKNRHGDFLARNGLVGGKLYVWVPDDSAATTPAQFNGSGTLKGRFVEVDNTPNPGAASLDGSSGYDQFGYPTQGNLWIQAEALGAFGFSRPEDVATNPDNGSEFVLASTGVDNYVGGVDTFGTIYTMDVKFGSLKADLTIVYDGDADPGRTLRSPDNLDWADNGMILVQEDKAEQQTLSGEPLFGSGAENPFEAGIVEFDPSSGSVTRIAEIDRSVVLDASLADPTLAVDVDAGVAGEWESSGILDVSSLFGEKAGTLFLFDVQAHGIEDQSDYNPESRISDFDLREGGQLLFLEKTATGKSKKTKRGKK